MKDFFHSHTLKTLCIFIAFGFLCGSCKHKTDFNDLKEVSYSKDIAPIINSNCAYSGCHGSVNYEHFSIVSYDGISNAHITPGSPEKSRFYQVLKTYGDDIMPKKPYNELTESQILLIYVWIGQGAKNN